MACRNTLIYSRRTGIFTAVGFGLGIVVHLSYALFGLTWLIAQYEVLFQTIKYLGAGYLIFIGLKSLLSSPRVLGGDDGPQKKDITRLQAVKIGWMTNVLNPKATLFFLSLFSVVVGPEPSRGVMVAISIILVGTTVLWFALVAVLMAQAAVQKRVAFHQKKIQVVFGILLIFIGIKVGFF
jgi:threonine/homoserine/homoserine lactone efflux protein